MASEAAPLADRTAIVFGASGVTGHAILRQLLDYPSPTTFTRIIGLTNRPLSTEVARLPKDGRIELYSGFNLLDREASLLQLQHIPGIQGVTNAYFAAYTGHGKGYEELKATNAEMLSNAVGGLEICCPNLQFITLNTGGKAYGVEFQDKVPWNPPLKESSPRVPEPYASNIFYYAQYDILANASAGKPWNFCEIRPDVIVGFVPQNNFMNMAQGLALYFSLEREIKGEGSEVRFPYGEEAWEALHTDSSADLLARFHVHASMHPEGVAGRAFNVVDGPAFTWRELWPRLAEYFGLRGTGPGNGKGGVKDAVVGHKGEWAGFVAKRGLKEGALEATGFDFVDAVMGIPFRRDMDSTARKEVGLTEERDVFEGYRRAFDEMRAARIIP